MRGVGGGSEYTTGDRGRGQYTCARCGRIITDTNNAMMRYCTACHAFEDPLGLTKPAKKLPKAPFSGGVLGQSVMQVLWDELLDQARWHPDASFNQDLERLNKIRRDKTYVIHEEPEL